MRGNRNFIQGGGGGPGLTAGKQSGQRLFFFVFFFYSPELILQLTEVLLQRKLYFSKDPGGGGPEFSRGRGSNFFLMLISKETHITCDFPGDPDPLFPLWIRTCLRM